MFWDFTWIEIILPRSDKTLIKILFSSNFGMQISAKIWDYLKNNKNLNPFENSKEYKFLDFTWIEINLPRFDTKRLIKILFSSNFGMQISVKIWD